MQVDWRDYIVSNRTMHDGRPTIRGMRIAVSEVLEYLASGMSVDEVVSDFPEVTREERPIVPHLRS